MKQLPAHYKEVSSECLELIEKAYREQMAWNNSMADLIKRELKRRKKLEKEGVK